MNNLARYFYKLLSISLLLVVVSLLLMPESVNAQTTTILNNNKLRMGNGSENSVNASGNLQQPFYYNSVRNAWRKLTYSVYPLDNAFAIGGDKTNEWNLNGTRVENPTLSNQVIDKSGFIANDGVNGYGTIISKGNITVGSSALEVENTYTLPQNSAYIEVKVKVKNVSAAPVENVRIWVGTRDDFVAETDQPNKQKGNLVDGAFVKITDPATRASALRISTPEEGILFYTNSDRGNTIIQSCCSFQNVTNLNPQTSVIDQTSDGSYGFYVRFNDLPVGASDEFTWYYAAGELADLNDIIKDVASASSSVSDNTSSGGTLKGTSSVNVTGYWLAVPHNATPPTAAEIKAGENYGSVTVAASGSSAMTANEETTFKMTGLSPSTEYDYYFVTEDASSQFSDISSGSFSTHALPTVSSIAAQTTCQDVSVSSVSFTVGDAETAAESLTVTAISSNTALVPNANITFGGSGSDRTVSVTPAAGQYGTSNITVTVTDADGDVASTTFAVNVNLNNTEPPVVTDVTYYANDEATPLSAQATGSNLLWYNTATGGTGSATAPTPATNMYGTQEFWVSQTETACESARAKITVTVNPSNEIAGSSTVKKAYYKQASIVDDQITVTGKEITNARVYIQTGFQANADVLSVGTLPSGVTSAYNPATGSLIFTGTATADQWQSIFRSIKFSSTSSNTADRSIKVVLGDAVGSTIGGKPHYYLYISTVSTISWTAARDAAASKRFFGLTGYLATITSQTENNFVRDKLSSDGWIGGSDNADAISNASESNWYWATGPEKGTAISRGNTNPVLAGAYMNWNPGEPNNANDEDYMQLYSLQNGKWNDLANVSPAINGYVVEFGGYDADPALQIESSRTLTYYKPATPSTPVLADGNNGYINDATPTVTGTAEPNVQVNIYEGTTLVASVTAGEDGNWSYTFTTDLSEGVHNISADATDLLGYTGDKTPVLGVTVDTQAPSAPVILAVSEDRGPVNNDRITSDNTLVLSGTAEANAEITISEATQGQAGTAHADASGKWVFNFEEVELPEEIYSLTATAMDAAGNTGEASDAFALTIDLTAPTVTIQSNVTSPVNAPFDISVVFSEQVYTLAAAAFEADNAEVSGLATTDGLTYTATLTPTTDGPVNIKLPAAVVTDLSGNANTASNTVEAAFDATRPTVAITSAAPERVKASFNIQITFSEPVTGFDAADVTIENGSLKNLATADSKIYTALVEPAANGAVNISIAENVAADVATNSNTASNTVTHTYDVIRPTVAVASEAPAQVNGSFDVSITFSENITGFALNALTVINASVSSSSQADSKVYIFHITPTTDGEVSVSVAADMAQDLALNGNDASNTLTRVYDATKPTLALATAAADPANAPFTVAFKFSELVSGFDVSDIAVANGVASDFSKVSDSEYTALITPAMDGAVNVTVASGVAADLATNTNAASDELALTYDATAPAGYAVAFNTTRIDVTNVTGTALQISGAEPGTTYFYSVTSNNGGAPVSGEATVTDGQFDISTLDLTALNDGQLTVTLYLVDAAGNKGADVTAEVVKITRNIVAVTAPPVVKVPIRTTYTDVPMPAKVQVTYATGATEEIDVIWSQGDYNGVVAGAYELTGELVLAPMTTNIDSKFATVVVEVQPNKVPTTLAFSATTFKPEATAADVIGTFSTTDPDDSEFVYTLVSGAGDADNSLFEVKGDKLYLQSNKGLSGKTEFTVRVRSTDPYNNVIEKSFTISKTLYAKAEEQLKIVNAFSPDGDGINDTWIIPELRFYNNVEIEVFDRSGVRVYRTTNPEAGWNGTGLNGKVLAGAFFYVVQVKDINMVKKGVVTILKK